MDSTASDLSDRYLRQSSLVPQELLRAHEVTVVGVGAIGRQVALQLATMGVGGLILIDPDQVESVNLGAQGFLEGDLGRPKVEATAELIHRLNSEVSVETRHRRFRRSSDGADVIFCCVDSIETRGHIFAAVKDTVRCFVDGRMSAEALRIITVTEGEGLKRYPTTLFRGEEAHQGPCTARTTFYAASVAAGVMVGHFTKWLRGIEVAFDVNLNLLADELVVCGSEPAAEVAYSGDAA